MAEKFRTKRLGHRSERGDEIAQPCSKLDVPETGCRIRWQLEKDLGCDPHYGSIDVEAAKALCHRQGHGHSACGREGFVHLLFLLHDLDASECLERFAARIRASEHCLEGPRFEPPGDFQVGAIALRNRVVIKPNACHQREIVLALDQEHPKQGRRLNPYLPDKREATEHRTGSVQNGSRDGIGHEVHNSRACL